MKIIILILTLTTSFHLSANNDPILNEGDRLYVVAESGINARSFPSTGHSVLFGIGYGEKVEVVESAEEASVCIDDLHGNWIKISYGNQIGYVFDGYLSKLPPVEYNSDANSADYIDQLKNYALMQIGSSMPKVSYDNMVEGEGTFKIDIYNLKNGCQYVEYNYWEGMDVELQLSNLRNAEVAIMLEKLFGQNPNFDKNEIPALENGNTIQFPSEDGFYVTVRKSENKYSIFLEVGSCC